MVVSCWRQWGDRQSAVNAAEGLIGWLMITTLYQQWARRWRRIYDNIAATSVNSGGLQNARLNRTFATEAPGAWKPALIFGSMTLHPRNDAENDRLSRYFAGREPFRVLAPQRLRTIVTITVSHPPLKDLSSSFKSQRSATSWSHGAGCCRLYP